MTRTATVPLEIWENILSRLSKYNLAPCLAVSRTFHKIAQRLVFTSVALIFDDESKTEAGRYLTNQTREILDRITLDAQFALLIKDLRVYVSKPSLYIFEHCGSLTFASSLTILSIYLQGYLMRAIPMLPNIKAFGCFYQDNGFLRSWDDSILAQAASYLSILPKDILKLSLTIPK
jgi:hypothetical protein